MGNGNDAYWGDTCDTCGHWSMDCTCPVEDCDE